MLLGLLRSIVNTRGSRSSRGPPRPCASGARLARFPAAGKGRREQVRQRERHSFALGAVTRHGQREKRYCIVLRTATSRILYTRSHLAQAGIPTADVGTHWKKARARVLPGILHNIKPMRTPPSGLSAQRCASPSHAMVRDEIFGAHVLGSMEDDKLAVALVPRPPLRDE